MKEYKRKNYKIEDISPEDRKLITVKDLSTTMKRYKKNNNPTKTIADFLGL